MMKLNLQFYVTLTTVIVAGIPFSTSSRPGKFDLSLSTLEDESTIVPPTCCPDSPTLYCDFVFHGFEHIIPTFHLQDGMVSDHPLLTFPTKFLNWKGSTERFSPTVIDVKTKTEIIVSSNTINGTFLQCPTPLPENVNTEGQFYVTTGYEQGAKLFARTFTTEEGGTKDRKFFQDRCVLLPLTSLAISTPNATNNLVPGDGNLEYPEKRRCILFKTVL